MIHTKYSDFINEAKRTPIDIPNIPNTMNFWHGGNLDGRIDINHKMKRSEYGVGLYLTTNLSVAEKYSRGSRKLYLVTVENGQNIESTRIDIDILKKFINDYVISNKRNEILSRLSKHIKDGKVNASVFDNIIMNESAIKSTKLNQLKTFYIENGIDYRIVNNAFGFGEDMLVLYNMKKLVQSIIIKPNDDIYDIEL